MHFAFDPCPIPAIAIVASSEIFPVHRIYCVGKNYAAHIREMGADPAREPPCFFLKPSDAIVTSGRMPYPPGTRNLHYEGELVIAIGKGGLNIAPDQAQTHIFGHALGLDMTRRDLQTEAGRNGQPWDTGKAFDHAAPVSAITPLEVTGPVTAGILQLRVNGQLRQDANLDQMIWNSNEIISELSKLYRLQRGDLIFTGTPAGVGPVLPGDDIDLHISGLGSLRLLIEPPEAP